MLCARAINVAWRLLASGPPDDLIPTDQKVGSSSPSERETGGQTDQEWRSVICFAVVILLTRHKPATKTIRLAASELPVGR